MLQLRVLRERKNLSIREIADGMNVSVQAVGKWERNEAFPKAAQLPKLADLLGCTIDELYGRDTA